MNILSSFHGNWVDLAILAVLIYFVSEAWRFGFWIILADFLGFLLSLVIALTGYPVIANILKTNFLILPSLSNAISFLLTAGVTEAFLGFILSNIVTKIPAVFWKKPWNNIAAILPSLGQGLILTAFTLTLMIGLPLSSSIKNDITQSRIGGFLVQKTSGMEMKIKEIFGGLAEESLTYLTIKPGSEKSITIQSATKNLNDDEASEQGMFKLVNEERSKRGIKALIWRGELMPIARLYARDMWQRNYFGHVTPEGKNIVDRLNEAGISFEIVGENLAQAPTLATAHTGLMNSEGHRDNILEPDFKRVGIGVIDNGIYGKLFVQIFTD